MFRITLTDGEFDTIRREMLTYPDHRVCKKLTAVLMVAQGIERQMICKHLGIGKTTLVGYVKLFLAEGLEGIKRNNYVRPASPLEKHTETLEKYFDENPPRSVAEAMDVIKKLTGLEYKKTFVHKFLVLHGYRILRTGGVPAKADVAGQEEFKKNVGTPCGASI